MAWTPALPDVDFGLPLLENLVTVIERDQAEALAWAAAKPPVVASLASFARVLKCERVSRQFPSLAVYPVTDAPDFGDDGASVDSPCVFGFEVAVTGTKPEELAEELRKRVAAVRMMAISSPADLVAGIVSVSKLIIEFGAAQFEQVREHETTAGLYYRSATFTITLRYIQTGG
ncbi:MAG: hypothetical protein AB7U82_27645 [Blastocatellales bacterium]